MSVDLGLQTEASSPSDLMWYVCLLMETLPAGNRWPTSKTQNHSVSLKRWSLIHFAMPHKGTDLLGTAAIIYRPTKVGYMENREGLLRHPNGVGIIHVYKAAGGRPASVQLQHHHERWDVPFSQASHVHMCNFIHLFCWLYSQLLYYCVCWKLPWSWLKKATPGEDPARAQTPSTPTQKTVRSLK